MPRHPGPRIFQVSFQATPASQPFLSTHIHQTSQRASVRRGQLTVPPLTAAKGVVRHSSMSMPVPGLRPEPSQSSRYPLLQILPVGHNARWADAQRRVADIVRWSRYPLGGRTLSHAGLRSGMIVTMPVSSMVFFRPLIWLAGSSFAHIFDSGFPRENHVSLLIGTVRPQRDEAFLLAYLNDLDAHCHRITNMDRSNKFERLPQIDAPRSRKIHPDRR